MAIVPFSPKILLGVMLVKPSRVISPRTPKESTIHHPMRSSRLADKREQATPKWMLLGCSTHLGSLQKSCGESAVSCSKNLILFS